MPRQVTISGVPVQVPANAANSAAGATKRVSVLPPHLAGQVPLRMPSNGSCAQSCATCVHSCNNAKDRVEKADKEGLPKNQAGALPSGGETRQEAQAAHHPIRIPIAIPIQSHQAGETAYLRNAYYWEEGQRTKERARLKEQGGRLSADERKRLEALEEEILRKHMALDALKMKNLENALSSLDCPSSLFFLPLYPAWHGTRFPRHDVLKNGIMSICHV